MSATHTRPIAIIAALTCLLSPATDPLADGTDARDGQEDPRQSRLVWLSVLAPEADRLAGLITNTGWSLVLRIDAPRSVAIVESPEESGERRGRREAIVLTDPDGCLDMRHFPIVNAGLPYGDCPGPDETFLEFTTERFDNFDVLDDNTGNFQVRARLVDDLFVAGALLNKPYLRDTRGRIVALRRPQTGDDLLDGYGFGPDDDLPGLVIMSNLGAARAFDEDFDFDGRYIRNAAGFVNGVSQELLTPTGGSALTATLQVVAGQFEPVALIDLDVDLEDADYLRRVDSGPVQKLRFPSPPQGDDEVLRAIASGYSPYELDIRLAVVEGVAPEFILDANGDGRFTSVDLRRMGYRLLSNEARVRLLVDFDLPLTETISGRTCPPPSLIYKDLDGNGRDGAISCSGTGGAVRVRPVPR